MKEYNAQSTYLEVLSWASSFLKSAGVEESVAKWLMLERFAMTQTDFIINRNNPMPKERYSLYVNDIQKAAKHYPPQYIVGHEWFYDNQFLVTPDTLIPRPETEEWFDQYIHQLPEKSLTVADIGTGSGVLGITHKLIRPQDEVILTDISEAALEVAQQNANQLGADVTFYRGAVLKPLIENGIKLDLLISNPPYISEDEWEEMDESVRTFEPKNALFANNNGLAIYEKLLRQSSKVVSCNSTILLEIGYLQAEAVKRLTYAIYPQASVEILTDINGLDRVVKVIV